MKRKDPRPEEYLYWKQLMKHLNRKDGNITWNSDIIFQHCRPEGMIYPRQLEIHLPGDHKRACDLACSHCAGKYFIKELGNWESDALRLLSKLEGKIPYHIYGGAYTEPIINPYFLTFLATTKRYGNHFGIHTNGTQLLQLEKNQGWLTELNRLSTDTTDYLSISIDAGRSEDWAANKGGDEKTFGEILRGINMALRIRDKTGKGHSIRLCYLINDTNDTINNLESISNFAKAIGVDSLRFSIPFAHYKRSFADVKRYKRGVEELNDDRYYKDLLPYLSKSKSNRPYIFYTGPEYTDIDKYTFTRCIYGYYQITLGADGYIYKCSTTATPTAKHCRLGKITPDLWRFREIIQSNYNPNWSCQISCFDQALRCNRMGLEINRRYHERSSADR